MHQQGKFYVFGFPETVSGNKGASSMKSDSTDPTDKLIDDIHNLHTSAWATAAPPTSKKQVYERAMLGAMRSLSVELLRRGVTTAIMEGTYLLWWLRFACINHHFVEGGFERSLKRIGPIVGPISDILIRIGKKTEDEGPLPEMRRLGEKLEELRGLAGGAVATWPDSKEAEVAQTEIANTLIQKTTLMSIDAGIPSEVIESLLLYFWFRSTVNRYGLPEAFFQKVERHWDESMDQVNRYMDEQAAVDRQRP